MDKARFQAALGQVLENYRRCGLSRFVRTGHLPEAWQLSLRQMGEQPAPADAATAASPGNVQRTPQSASAGGSPRAPSSPQPQVGWQLPVLDLAAREARFAELAREVEACRLCENIVNYRQQTVFGDGTLQPELCFVGEAPGADEDRQGVPFVGRAGQLLTKIIAAMTLRREEVYILNALRCRPPQNRTPVPDEVDNCRQFVEQQLEVLQPKYIVCLGAVAVRSILQNQQSIGRLRGRFHDYRGARVVVTYHPSYLLRNESAKKLVWEDMKMLMHEMGLPRDSG